MHGGYGPLGSYNYPPGYAGYGGVAPPPWPADGHYDGAGAQKEKKSRSKSKKAGKSSRSRSRSKGKRGRAAALVPDKEAYVRLLAEVAGWNEAKKKNLVTNAFAMLSEESQAEIRSLTAPAQNPRKQTRRLVKLPPADPSSDLLCTVNSIDKAARVPEGSYVFAFRREWGFLALYKKVKSSSPAGERVSSSSRLPDWGQLLDQAPALYVLLLEVIDLAFDSNTVKINASGTTFRLQFATKDFETASTVLRASHKACRPFSPRLCVAEFYVDGVEFYPHLADGILAAESEILMAAWWLSPYIFLKRGEAELDQNFRLDNLLQRKAFAGVKISILLYQEVERATALTSHHTKSYLESLHPNIHVVRHRDRLQFTHHQKFTVVDWKVLFVGGLDPCYGRYDVHDHPLFDDSVALFPGLDYRNPMLLADEASTQTKYPFQTALNRLVQNRLPWHDVHIRLEGKVAYDAGLNFAQRWQHHPKNTGRKAEARSVLPDVSVLYQAQKTEEAANVRATLCRSIAEWSGSPVLEKYIHQAYVQLIEKSTDFIYIENQYFISSLCGTEVSNRVAQALVDRITLAHSLKQTFRVLMLIQPHGEGDPTKDQFIWSVLYYQNQTLQKMCAALLKNLGSQEAVDQHFMVGYAQQHGVSSEGKPTCAPIYIHSKFLMADDLRFVVGSANINDRSFNGDRDSELAVLVEQMPAEMAEGKVNGKMRTIGSRVRQLRKQLWIEHFGLAEDVVEDPASDWAWQAVHKVMADNTRAYQAVFPAAPANRITTLDEAQRAALKPTSNEHLLKEIKGHAVLYPVYYLSAVLPTMIALATGANMLV